MRDQNDRVQGHLSASLRQTMRRYALSGLALLLCAGPARAAVGVTSLPATPDEGRISVFYPTTDEPADPPGKTIVDAPVVRGNGRLVVLSHGSGGSAYVHGDLARALVAAGFVVAVPAHRGDSHGDSGRPGPDSWTIRPGEVSRAIDAVDGDPRFAPLLAADKVGVYGMSAGGHTALSLAGGRWSPAGFVRHCEVHLAEDFPACVGLATRLTGGVLDGLRKWLALAILRWRFGDDAKRIDHDPRVAAVVAAVPFAADFDPRSLERPRVPLALITADRDRWLAPRFHGDRILAVCKTCEHLVALTDGGHGALLSPAPSGLSGLEADLLNDPPGFDRAEATQRVDTRVVDFFERHLLERTAIPRS